eukprot:16949-Eustigmatos_ZCMA.PRE.1
MTAHMRRHVLCCSSTPLAAATRQRRSQLDVWRCAPAVWWVESGDTSRPHRTGVASRSNHAYRARQRSLSHFYTAADNC